MSTVVGCRLINVERPLKIETKSTILQTPQHVQMGEQVSCMKSVGITDMNGEHLETRCCFGCWCGSTKVLVQSSLRLFCMCQEQF